MIHIYRDVIMFGFLNFFFEMFFAVLLFMRRCPKREHFILRVLLVMAASMLFYFLPSLRVSYFNFDYLIVVAVIVGAILLCYRVSPFGAVFFSVAAFSAQHIGWQVLLGILEGVGLEHFTQATGLLCYAGSYLVTYAAIFFLFPPLKNTDDLGRNKVNILVISALLVIFDYAISAILSGKSLWNGYTRLYAVGCCLFALFTQVGLFRTRSLRNEKEQLERDKAVLEQLFYQSKKQQELTKSTIEIIDRKCHDLKHQISALRTMDAEEREKHIAEIEEAVMIYSNIAKTSNAVINVVLTEKGLLCEQYKIKFTYIVDGDSLAFLDPVDLSSLFGNAIDNAIESVMKEEDEEKRVIKLNVALKGGFLGVHIENYCGDEVIFEDGIPVTGKPDKENHGFGVKSIRFVAEKYGGCVDFGCHAHIFSLNILFPFAEGDTKKQV